MRTIKYAVVVYRNGEPVVVFDTEFLNLALEELERRVTWGERFVAIERLVVEERVRT